ncbi:MAG: NRDE family protein [Acidimicrobiales bacterium]
MCTVLLRVDPGSRWPVRCGAIRDEFADRPWDPPGQHWEGRWPGLIGGRDRTAGGTWLAVDPSPDRPAVAALLNGVRRPLADGELRPTRGTLALEVLTTGAIPTAGVLPGYDGFHLVLATLAGARVWTWDGEDLLEQDLADGDHILVNLGVDTDADPLVPHFAPLLSALPDPLLTPDLPSRAAWEPWTDLLAGDGLDPADPRALIVRREIEGRTYASTSATLVALSEDGVRYDFNPDPRDPSGWYEVHLADGPAPLEAAT